MKKKFLIVSIIFILLVSIASQCMAVSPIEITPPTDTAPVKSVGNQVASIGIILVIGLVVYLIPTIVACAIKHPQKLGIILINIFLGWSLVGWVSSLVWACILSDNSSSNRKME